MATLTINEQNEIVAFATPEEAAATTATPFDAFSSQQELAELAASWPAERLVAILNSLAGEKPVKKLKDAKTAIVQIWEGIQGLAEPAKAEPGKAKADKKRKAGAQTAKGASAKGKATKKTSPAKSAPKAKKAAKTQETAGPREGSKTAQVVAMLQRKNGATLSEIMPYASHCTSLA